MMKEAQPSTPNSEEQPFIETHETTDEEAKQSASHPPEHIAKIIERGNFAPTVGSIIAKEAAQPEAKPSPQELEIDKATEPEVVLEKVEEAAEQNAPIELEYELSHEAKDQALKDEPKIEDKKYETVSVDRTMYANNFPTAPSEKVKAEPAKILKKTEKSFISPLLLQKSTLSLYKQAILGGLGAAALLILLFMLFTIAS